MTSSIAWSTLFCAHREGAVASLYSRPLLLYQWQAISYHPQGGWFEDAPLSALQLPPTVHGVLAARIDRLARKDKDLL
jgi:hypothetical protein